VEAVVEEMVELTGQDMGAAELSDRFSGDLALLPCGGSGSIGTDFSSELGILLVTSM